MAAAAIGGWNRGAERGREIVRERQRERASLRRHLREKQDALANQIVAWYDKDGSKALSKSELITLLKDCSLEKFGEETLPSPDDIDFLFKLCDKTGPTESGDDVIDQTEVLQIVDAWSEFLNEKETLLALFKAHDFDQSGSIDCEELQGILDEVREGDKLKKVEPEVTAWIFEQADITGSGVLSVLELARALCAYDLWLGKRTQCPVAPDQMLVGINKKHRDLPAPVQMSDSEWKQYSERKAKILEVLRKVDLNGDDRFELKEIASLLVQIGVPEDKVDALTKVIDANSDSVITVNEFLNWIFSTSDEAKQVLHLIAPSTGIASCCTIS